MIRKSAALLATAVLAGALTVGLFAAPAQAALRHIDGTVVSKNSDNRTFKLTTQNGNQVRIKVNSTTKFDRLAGFGALQGAADRGRSPVHRQRPAGEAGRAPQRWGRRW